MPAARKPTDEAARLGALRELEVLDTAAEPLFDEIVALAATICETPISLVSLVDDERQWFKANHGLAGASETPREQAFCAHAILQAQPLEVADATADPRFVDNPLVTGAPGIRFYAGMPLTLESGHRVGTLCVIDRQPRTLSALQREQLELLARVVAKALELRDAQREAKLTSLELLATSEQTPGMVHVTDAEGRLEQVSDHWLETLGYRREQVIGAPLGDFLSEGSRTTYERMVLTDHAPERVDNLFMQMRTGTDDWIDVRFTTSIRRDDKGTPVRTVTRVEDIAPHANAEAALVRERRMLANIIEAIDVATWQWDIPSGTVTVNERWAELIGYRLTDLEPLTIDRFGSLVHEDDFKAVQAALERHFSGEIDFYEVEIRMRHREGHWVWLLTRGRALQRDGDGAPMRMFGVHLDIEDRKRQEVELERQKKLLQATGALAGVGGWEVHLDSGSIFWTPQTREIHGVGEDYVPDLQTALSFYPPYSRKIVEAAMDRAIATGEGWDLELPFSRASGERIWVRAIGSVDWRDGRARRLHGAFQDVTQRRRMHDELQQRSELMHVTLASIGDGVITTAANGCITFMNSVAERLTGTAQDEARGTPVQEVFRAVSENTRESLPDPVDQCLRRREVYSLADDALLISRDGSERAIENSTAPIADKEGQILGAVMVFRDVTEHRRLSVEMSYRATHDALTGLINRTEFEHRLAQALGSTRQTDLEHVLLYLDLDRFKIVNDTCGHTAGDELLVQVAGIFASAVRAQDTVARLGGDEFALIIERCSVDVAESIANSLCRRIQEYRFVHGKQSFQIGCSIGLVPVHADWLSTSSLMQAADSACYDAKEAGRNQVITYRSAKVDAGVVEPRTRWGMEVERALDDDEGLELHGQHIFGTGQDGEDRAIELLVRLRDPNGNLAAPGTFFPAAERYHLMTRLDQWVFERALQCLRTSEGDHTTLFVNVSPAALGDQLFHEFVMNRLERLAPALRLRLAVEVGEAAVIAHLEEAKRFLVACRTFGVRTVLDEFGSATASFRYLRDLDLDYLKIHGPLVSSVLDDRLSQVTIKSFAEVAKTLDIRPIATHIESPEILDVMETLGVSAVQGFFLHQPEPLAAALAADPPSGANVTSFNEDGALPAPGAHGQDQESA